MRESGVICLGECSVRLGVSYGEMRIEVSECEIDEKTALGLGARGAHGGKKPAVILIDRQP